MIRFVFVFYLLALPLSAQLVFDQHIAAGVNVPSGHWYIQAHTAESACNGRGGLTPCYLSIHRGTDGRRIIFIRAAYDHGGPSPRSHGPVLSDWDAGGLPTMSGGFPWTDGPISFSGTWDYSSGALDGMEINAGDAYSGSFDFDLDGGGQPINVSVSFTLSEP
jgi:hypothetical protein